MRPIFYEIVMPELEANDLFRLRDVFRDPFPHGRSHRELLSVFTLDPVDPLRIFMMSVDAQIMPDKERDQHETGHADGQTKNVDQGITFVFNNVSYSEFQRIFEHGRSPIENIFDEYRQRPQKMSPVPEPGPNESSGFINQVEFFVEIAAHMRIGFISGQTSEKPISQSGKSRLRMFHSDTYTAIQYIRRRNVKKGCNIGA